MAQDDIKEKTEATEGELQTMELEGVSGGCGGNYNEPCTCGACDWEAQQTGISIPHYIYKCKNCGRVVNPT